VRDRLEKLSSREDLSLNHAANKGLREYAEWGAIYRNLGMAVIGKRLMRDLYDNLSEEKARELGRKNALEEAPTFVISLFGVFNLENVLRVFGNILAKYSGVFVFEHSKEGRSHTVVVRHEMGRRASAYYAEYARTICELLKMPCVITETEDQVLIKAQEPIGMVPEDSLSGLPAGLIEESSKS
jgi:hypothetical protein